MTKPRMKNLKRLLIGATIALSVLLPLGVAYADPPKGGSLAVFGLNLLGDSIRDLTDPRLRGGLG